MTLEIKKYPSTVLRKKSEKIEKITPEIQSLAKEMIQSMLESEGVGLAAPQVGVSKRLIVVRILQDRSREEKNNHPPRVFINPEITRKSRETAEEEEGCLSLPNLFLKIKRAKWVEITALDIEGKNVQLKASGLASRIFQHEIDHLDGVLIVDRAGIITRLKTRSYLKNLKKNASN